MATRESSRSTVARTIMVRVGTCGACLAVVLSLYFLLSHYFLEVERERARLAPPAGVKDLAAFSTSVSPPRRLTVVQHDGGEYIVWYGELSGPLDKPSGPSCYLFDSDGTLIDWQPETGEGARIDRFLESSSKGREITVQEALKMVKRSATSGEPTVRDGPR